MNTAIGVVVTVVNDIGGYLTFNPPRLHWASARTTTGDYATLVSVGGLSNFMPHGLTRISHSPDAASSTALMAALSHSTLLMALSLSKGNVERAVCSQSVGRVSHPFGGKCGLTIGRTIILSSDAEHDPAVRNHEAGHVPQSRIYGIFYIPIVGGTTWLRKRSPFERDADARGIGLDYGGTKNE